MVIRGIAAWLLAMVLLASAAHAHGGVGMRDNRCVLRIGPDIMFFTGYQPQNSRDEFCDDIPTTGQTVVALDMQDSELRDMLTEIRIIRDEGNHTTMNGLPFLTDAELGSPQVLDQGISDGHLDLRAYLSRERQIHRHRDGEKHARPDLCVAVPVFGGPNAWQKHGNLRGDGRGARRRGLLALAPWPEAEARSTK